MAPVTTEQLFPSWSQRFHAYAKPVGELLHVPFEAVSVEPTATVPEIDGSAVFTGALAAGAETTVVGAEVAGADPSAFVAVTVTRRVVPTSAACTW